MDPSNFFNSIKNIASSLHCPSCGKGYGLGEIKLHSKDDSGLVFSANCNICNLPVWVNVVTKNLIDTIEPRELAPITANEVIDFHLSLKSFDGDFRSVFKED